MSPWMNARWRSACGLSAMFSATLQVVHMTSSSMSTSEALGVAPSAIAGAQERGEQRAEQRGAPHPSARFSAASKRASSTGPR